MTDTYHLELDDSLAGCFYEALGNDPNCHFISYGDVDNYTDRLAAAIREHGITCYVNMARYRTAELMRDLDGFVTMDDEGFRLVEDADIEDVTERFYGTIPLAIIRVMEEIEIVER